MNPKPDLPTRIEALAKAAELAQDRLAPELLARAHGILEHAGTRMRLAPEHTIVALAGATGSGKSSLLNAVAGSEVAVAGVIRPTTSQPAAAVFSAPDSSLDALLNWLDVGSRQFVSAQGSNVPPGLVVLDLPDHDSVERSHRLVAHRLIERVDLLVWVLDPQKYADNAIHTEFLRPLAGQSEVMLLVLNQVDRLSVDDAGACLRDLERLAADDGLSGVPVLGVSARSGQGVEQLRDRLFAVAERRRAAVTRLELRVGEVAEAFLSALGPDRGASPRIGGVRELDLELARAAGVDQVVAAVRTRDLLRARAATGWPVTRWLGRFRIDPLRRLNLHRGPESAELALVSRPEADVQQRARVHIALREYAGQVVAGLPEPWAVPVRERIEAAAQSLPADLDLAIAGTELEAGRRPRWWSVLNVWQWVLFGVLVAGVAWLTVLGVFSYFRLPQPPTPEWRRIPWPTLLVFVGAGLGLLSSGVAWVFTRLGARRSAGRARRRLEQAVGGVGLRLVHEPVRAELAALEACRVAARTAAGGGLR